MRQPYRSRVRESCGCSGRRESVCQLATSIPSDRSSKYLGVNWIFRRVPFGLACRTGPVLTLFIRRFGLDVYVSDRTGGLDLTVPTRFRSRNARRQHTLSSSKPIAVGLVQEQFSAL